MPIPSPSEIHLLKRGRGSKVHHVWVSSHASVSLRGQLTISLQLEATKIQLCQIHVPLGAHNIRQRFVHLYSQPSSDPLLHSGPSDVRRNSNTRLRSSWRHVR